MSRVLKKYTLYMNNHHDQLRSVYGIKKKALKWEKYAFFFLVDVVICNSFTLISESDNHKARSQVEYRMALAHLVLKDFSMKRRLVTMNAINNSSVHHWPVSSKRGRCKLCLSKKKRHESKMSCEQCKVPLCLNCFKPYHVMAFPDMF